MRLHNAILLLTLSLFFKFIAQVAVAAANAEEEEMAAAMAKTEAQEMAEMAATPDAKVAFAAGSWPRRWSSWTPARRWSS